MNRNELAAKAQELQSQVENMLQQRRSEISEKAENESHRITETLRQGKPTMTDDEIHDLFDHFYKLHYKTMMSESRVKINNMLRQIDELWLEHDFID